MIFKRFYDDKLAQASFIIGCGKSGEAAVIDPNRDVEQYLQAAAAEGLKITAVTETHIHADFVSGSRELAQVTGAQLYLSDEGDADWKYGFANQSNVTLVKDGSVIRIGNVRLDVMKTAGHTPEHISFILTDEATAKEPLGAFTGDFIFVGDVGRPDLLERAAGFEGTMQAGGRTLFDSLARFKQLLPDTLILWPSHGAGSACGKSLSGVPMSTLGYEKVANWALRFEDSDEFTHAVLEGQPEPPRYFKEMKRINKVGPPLLGEFKIPARLDGAKILDLLASNEIVVDIRSEDEMAAGYIPGALNIPEGKSFTTWAGWLIPYDHPIYLLADSEADVIQATHDLQKIGLDEVRGWLGPDALKAHTTGKEPLATVTQISAKEAYARRERGEIEVIDVRGAGEYLEGHIPGVKNIPLGYLAEHIGELPKDKPVAIHCQGGTRSLIGVSVLSKNGFKNAINLTGGFMEYEEANLPIERDQAIEPVRV